MAGCIEGLIGRCRHGGCTYPSRMDDRARPRLPLWRTRSSNGRRREATGDMIIVRYADDFIVGFEHEEDARRFLDALRKRLGEFALSLNDEKTRLIEFGRFAAQNRKRRGLGKPATFNFLGFIFISGKSRRGKFQV